MLSLTSRLGPAVRSWKSGGVGGYVYAAKWMDFPPAAGAWNLVSARDRDGIFPPAGELPGARLRADDTLQRHDRGEWDECVEYARYLHLVILTQAEIRRKTKQQQSGPSKVRAGVRRVRRGWIVPPYLLLPLPIRYSVDLWAMGHVCLPLATQRGAAAWLPVCLSTHASRTCMWDPVHRGVSSV